MITYRKAEEKDYHQLLAFNLLHFPLRESVKEFIDYKIALYGYDSIYLAFDEEKLIAQRFALLNAYCLNENIQHNSWGTDFFVDPEYQGKGIGNKIVNQMLQDHKVTSTTNTGGNNIKIHSKMGYQQITDLHLLFRPLSVFYVGLTILFKRKSTYKENITFPVELYGFTKIESANQLQSNTFNWQVNRLETIRSLDFIDKRFFYKPNVYQVYSRTGDLSNSDYFVIRPIIWKNLNCIMIVEIKLKDEEKDLSSLLKLIIRFSKTVFQGILVANSLQKNQQIYNSKGFITYKKMGVISNISLEEDTEVAIQFSDGDLDFNYSNTPFVYGE